METSLFYRKLVGNTSLKQTPWKEQIFTVVTASRNVKPYDKNIPSTVHKQ